MSEKGGQHVGPSVGTFARLKRENMDLTLEVEQLKKELELFHNVDDENRDLKAELENLRELQVAAEDIDMIPRDWVHEDLRPKISALHKAIRKVRGMK
jgi:predicted RNase H-like nuclease (RuvC/YqgF family)